MRIVPVLDIKNGRVVRGVGGERAGYQPIETPLSPDADPVNVARGLDGLGPAGGFPEIYLADLDAIEGRAPNEAAVEALLRAFPAKRFWLDAGLRRAAQARAILARPGLVAVAGSETLASVAEMAALAGESRLVLSLDFRGETPLGDPALFRDPALWPERVIAMTLARVGSGAGPDLDRLRAVRAQAGGRAVFAAGGVRGPADVEALSRLGIAGALVSTALHDGRLAGVVAGQG